MIKNPDAPTFEQFIAMMTRGENLPDRVGGGAPTSERLEEHAAILKIISENPDGIRVMCVGCGGSVPMREGFACVCGGWVCPHCAQLEGDDDCNHERPPILPPPEDDD